MPDTGSRRIAILATGGTIAGRPQADGQGYRAGALNIGDLLAAEPALEALADLRAEQVANVGSQAITVSIWLRLAARIRELLADDQTDGIVVTHGTDTLEETAYFLSLVLPWTRPVILTGAMRPAGAPGADGPANLLDAVALASDPCAGPRGPLVTLNGAIHSARDVQKISASAPCAFASPNRGPLGLVVHCQAHWHHPPAARRAFDLAPATLAAGLPRVDVVAAYADAPADVVPWLVERGSRGIVLAGVGAGNASDPLLAALAQAVRDGVPVVRASRCGTGQVARNVEIDDDAHGFIAAGDLPPHKARVLLALSLLAGITGPDLQHCFDQY